jgi:hypothetical protein
MPRTDEPRATQEAVVIDYFLCFNANQRVGTHPFDLLTERGDTVEVPVIVREIDRDDVRLIVV